MRAGASTFASYSHSYTCTQHICICLSQCTASGQWCETNRPKYTKRASSSAPTPIAWKSSFNIIGSVRLWNNHNNICSAMMIAYTSYDNCVAANQM